MVAGKERIGADGDVVSAAAPDTVDAGVEREGRTVFQRQFGHRRAAVDGRFLDGRRLRHRLRQRTLGPLLPGRDDHSQADVAKPHFIPLKDLDALPGGQTLLGDSGPVGAAVVLHEDASLLQDDGGVVARYRQVAKEDFARLAAHAVGALVERVLVPRGVGGHQMRHGGEVWQGLDDAGRAQQESAVLAVSVSREVFRLTNRAGGGDGLLSHIGGWGGSDVHRELSRLRLRCGVGIGIGDDGAVFRHWLLLRSGS